jgi:hypothetical protein
MELGRDTALGETSAPGCFAVREKLPIDAAAPNSYNTHFAIYLLYDAVPSGTP